MPCNPSSNELIACEPVGYKSSQTFAPGGANSTCTQTLILVYSAFGDIVVVVVVVVVVVIVVSLVFFRIENESKKMSTSGLGGKSYGLAVIAQERWIWG